MRRQNFLITILTMLSLAAGIVPAATEDYPSMTLKMAHVVPPHSRARLSTSGSPTRSRSAAAGRSQDSARGPRWMGKPTELLDLVGSGAVNMAAVPAGYFPSKLPLTGMTNSVMMLFDDNELAVEVTEELVQKNKGIRDELKRNNIYPILPRYRHLPAVLQQACGHHGGLQGFEGRSWGDTCRCFGSPLGPRGWTCCRRRSTSRCSAERSIARSGRMTPSTATSSTRWADASDLSFGAIPTWPVWVNWNTFFNVWPPQVRKLLLEVGKERATVTLPKRGWPTRMRSRR